MNKYLFVLFMFLFLGIAIAKFTVAESDVQFPIAELGGCQNQTACKSYCDLPANAEPCLAFAEEHSMMTKEEISVAKKVLSGVKGPGGCTNKDTCETYCNNIKNIEECVSFAEENNLMSEDELAEARKIRDALRRGIKPPACNNKEACDEYCKSSDHMEECMNFALAAGLMDENERADAEKFLDAIKKGVKPPNCRGKEECDQYCSEETHLEECMNFAVAAGFVSEEDAEMAKKTGGKGPGGCRGKEECEAFCKDPNNQEICFSFSKENGLISEEQMKEMEEGNKRFAEGIENAPPEIKECLTQTFGDLENITPSSQNGEKMKECFEKFGGSRERLGGAGMRTGPGGCQNREECEAYCQSNPGACGPGPQERENREGERPMPSPQGEEMRYPPEMSPEAENYMREPKEEIMEPPEKNKMETPEPNESPSEGSEEPVSFQNPSKLFLNLLANILLSQ